MATITFEDDLWNEDGLFGDMEETKRGEYPGAAPGMPLFADVIDIMKRRIKYGEQNYTWSIILPNHVQGVYKKRQQDLDRQY